MKSKLSEENLYESLVDATSSLLEMARTFTWNKISNDCVYFLTEDDNNWENWTKRKLINDLQEPNTLDSLIPALSVLYSDIYEIDLYVHDARTDCTVIEIRYCLKYLLDEPYKKTVENDPPMLHCKVAVPPYVNDRDKKFDINWTRKNLRYKWRMLLFRLRFKIVLFKRKIKNSKLSAECSDTG